MSLLLVCDTAWTALNEMKLIILPTLKWMTKALTKQPNDQLSTKCPQNLSTLTASQNLKLIGEATPLAMYTWQVHALSTMDNTITVFGITEAGC